MLKVETKTSFTRINKNGQYVPNTADFMFRNSGNTMAFINNMPIAPGDVFGVTNGHLIVHAALDGKVLDIKDTTEFDLRIETTVAPGFETAYAGPSTPSPIMAVSLIRTDYKIIK